MKKFFIEWEKKGLFIWWNIVKWRDDLIGHIILYEGNVKRPTTNLELPGSIPGSADAIISPLSMPA